MHANSVCTPSRAALQTGRYNMRTGIHGNFDTDSTGGLALEEVTIGAFLSASPLRFQTFAGGKVCRGGVFLAPCGVGKRRARAPSI